MLEVTYLNSLQSKIVVPEKNIIVKPVASLKISNSKKVVFF